MTLCPTVLAQSDILSQEITLKKRRYSVRVLLEKILPSHDIPLAYHDNIVPLHKVIIFDVKPYTIEHILDKICRNDNLTYKVIGGQVLLTYYERPDLEYKYTISGRVKDADTGEVLIGASLYIQELASGVSANAYGFYAFTVPSGVYHISVSYLGYEPMMIEVDLRKNIKSNIELVPKPIQLDELTIDELNPMEIKAHTILSSTNRIDMEMAKHIPYLGEVDVFQGSLLLPGITNIGEGVSGVNVRGGTSDQNLVLMDEAVLYNPNHFFGLISVFNPDAVNDVEILKGDFPAKYGGRTSSVMHVRQREGNEKEFEVSGGLGLLTSRLMAEGPMFNQNGSFLVSGRATFWDLLLRNLSDPRFNDIRANFQDLNGKVKYNINAKNKLFMSGYWGSDATKYGTDALQQWGNSLLSLRWNHIMRNKHFINVTSYYSGYRYSLKEEEEFRDLEGRYSINDLAVKADITSYYGPGFIMDWGISSIHHRLLPGEVIKGELDTSGNEISLPDETSFESSVYASTENRIGSKLTVSLGLRFSHFINDGQSDVYVYEEGEPLSQTTIVDTLKAGSDENKMNFYNWLPRVSLKFSLGANSSAKVSYSSSVQYIHQLSNTTSPSSSDNWVMAGLNVLPTTMNQSTVGVYKFFPQWDMNASVEAYYRDLNDVIDYKNGANLQFNESVETELIYGIERAYGLEFFVKKSLGKWTGWAGYTLSRVERKFENSNESLEINNGNFFASDFDRSHDFALSLVYETEQRWSFSTNFVFYTGRPYSFPDSKYEVDGVLVPNYPSRNQDRLSNYHRLDVSATYQIKPMKKNGEKRTFESELVFSIYNVYSRDNAQAYFFSEDPDIPGRPTVNQLSVLAFPVPSVTYNFRF
ncbi:TonB-dependent receptor [Reichenbachiella agariperforans]|uniref:TonB-dependent receptor n=1 Tax=Reichenbachiella agariperforans TaxID=156994 RepID=UPI001C0A4DE9|nr:TonB-dependent receptor [Reichenbachiella agariperforans]MBU2916159.1 TonB-dependent receptor [Reichenbachiella agariperforans]